MAESVNNERELLQRISYGDEQAFRTFVLQYSDLLYAFLFSHLKDPLATEEIVQDILLQIWQTRETLSTIKTLKPYLFVISRNYALNEIKKQIRLRKHEDEWRTEISRAETRVTDATDQRISVIEEAINQLPPQQQRAWILSRREGLKYEEIGQQMGLSRNTVKKYLRIATASIIEYVSARNMSLFVLVVLCHFY